MSAVLALVVGLAACRRPGAVAVDETAGAHPSLRTGKLDNGLRYWLRRHPHPAGKVALRLYVATGWGHERSDEVGAAHFVEHLAFNGTANFAPGAAAQYLRSLGMEFGRDLNARTGVDSTVYRLIVPTGEPELKRGLLFLGDVSRRLSFAPSEIDREREVLVSEERVRATEADPTRTALEAARTVAREFAASGPTPGELAAAKAVLKRDIERVHASADYWARNLVDLEARGVSLRELEAAAEANAQLTLPVVKQALSRYLTDDGRFELIVLPP